MQAPSLWLSDTGRRRDHNICEGDTEHDHRIKNRQQQCCRVHRKIIGFLLVECVQLYTTTETLLATVQ